MRQFFSENATIITFAHGLVFFALGFAVWLQRRRTTRLTLSAALIWLATFAFVESIAIWGYVFVPIQAAYLDQGFVDVLIAIRAVVQVAAFVFLLEFGLRLAPISPRTRTWLSAAGIAASVAALLGSAAVASARDWSLVEWEHSAVAVCRYAVLLPGAVLSAVGVRRQRSELVASGMRGINRYAAAAAWVLLVYGVLAGLIVNDAPWAPPGLLNESRWLGIAGFPLAVLRALAGLALCAIAIKLLEIFEVETQQQLASLRRARLVAEERARFGRDLHDGTIQSIYAAGLQLESLAMRAGDAEISRGIRETVTGLNQTIGGIRTYIDALHESPAAPETLALALREQAHRRAADTGMEVAVRISGVAESGPLPAEIGHHAEHILREALSNASRHGHGSRAVVEVSFAPDEMRMVVSDDGVGIADSFSERPGRGLRNMRERARRLGGRLVIGPSTTGGTRVALEVPLDAEPELAPATPPDEHDVLSLNPWAAGAPVQPDST